MYPSRHIILGALFSAVLFFMFPEIGILNTGIIFLSSVLIDVDHYLYYVYKKKDWSLRRAYLWFMKRAKFVLSLKRSERNKVYEGFVFLHGFEVILILVLLGVFVSRYFFFIGVGFSFHLISDILYELKYRDRIDRVLEIYDFFKFKKLKLVDEINLF